MSNNTHKIVKNNNKKLHKMYMQFTQQPFKYELKNLVHYKIQIIYVVLNVKWTGIFTEKHFAKYICTILQVDYIFIC